MSRASFDRNLVVLFTTLFLRLPFFNYLEKTSSRLIFHSVAFMCVTKSPLFDHYADHHNLLARYPHGEQKLTCFAALSVMRITRMERRGKEREREGGVGEKRNKTEGTGCRIQGGRSPPPEGLIENQARSCRFPTPSDCQAYGS